MSDKEQYRKFIYSNSSEIELFYQIWWLDALVGKENWNVVIDSNQNGVRGFLLYSIEKNKGKIYFVTPRLSLYTGVKYFYPSDLKNENRFNYENEVLSSLLSKLPSFDYFEVKFHSEFKNWLPFHWDGFEQTTRYTYQLSGLSNFDGIQSNFKNSLKRNLKKAEENLIVSESDDVKILFDLNQKTYQKQGKNTPDSLGKLKRIDKELKERSCRKLLIAKDKDGNVHASIYIVWDFETAYYLIGGIDPAFSNSGATSLLMWNAIKSLPDNIKVFDFEGSMISSIERFFRSFGAKQVPYMNIKKVNSKFLKTMFFAKDLLSK